MARIRNISPEQLRRLFEAPEVAKPQAVSTSDAINLTQALANRELEEKQRQAKIAEIEANLNKMEQEKELAQTLQPIQDKPLTLFGRQVPMSQVASPTDMEAGQVGPSMLEQAKQQQQQQASGLAAKIQPVEEYERQFGSPVSKGTPPRSIESFYIDMANRGEIGIDEAVQKIQEAEPQWKPFKDAEGRTGMQNLFTQEKVFFTQERPAGEGGKSKIAQFTPEEQKRIVQARKEFQSSDFVKKQGAILKELDKIRALVESNPKGAIGPLRTQVSKVVAGEVGRLTDQDITRNIPTQDWDANFIEWFKNKTVGNLSKISVERYQDLLNILSQRMAESLNEELEGYVDNVADFETTDANKEAIRQNIGRGTVSFIDRHLNAPSSGKSVTSLEEAMALSPAERRARIEELKRKQAGGK